MDDTVDSQTISPQVGYENRLRIVLFGILSIAGLSFWFILGFPFGNHNESYLWMVQFNRMGLGEVLVKGLKPVTGFRPLGVAVAWLG